MLNILNAHFGVGAILGPALIGVVGAGHYPAVFLGFALVNLPLLLCLKGVRDRAPQPSGTADSPDALGRSLAAVLSVFVALYVLHVGIEAGVGGWEPTHLQTVGYGAGVAATATSVYWLMMTVGRFLVAPIALRFSAQAIITVSCAGMTVCLLLASVRELAPYAYAGVGLFIAPIFPTGLPWLHRAAPGARRAGALVIAASMIGGVAAGPALGKAIEWSGIRAVPLLLSGVSALCLAATLWLIRSTRTR
jgi:fucose permease